MPLKPQSLEEFFEQQESLTREQSFEPGEIHRYVRKALALVDGEAEPLVLALVCIAIGIMVGEQTGRAIIQDGYRAANRLKQENRA
jgi:hypothetical protein